MANFIGRLGVLLGLDSAEFRKGIEQASRQLDQFVEKARTSSMVGAAALSAMTAQAFAYADQISDTAKANDLAIDSVLKLRNALALNGGEAENASKFLASFTNSIEKAAEGSFETQQKFAKLGVSLGDIATLDTQGLIDKTLEGLSKMSDPLTRNAYAMDLFGKAAKNVDFAGLNNDIKANAGATDEQANAIKIAGDLFDKFEQHARDVQLTLVTLVAPALSEVIDYMKKFGTESGTGAKIFTTAFQAVAVVGANVAFVVRGIVEEIGAMFNFVKNATTVSIAYAIAENEKYIEWTKQARKDLDDFEKKILGIGSAVESVTNKGGESGSSGGAVGIRREVKPGIDPEALRRLQLYLKGQAELARQQEESASQLGQFYKASADALTNQASRIRLADKELDREKEMLQLVFKGRNMRVEDLQYQQELLEIEYKRRDNIEKIMEDTNLDADAKEYALRRENELAEKGNELARTRLRLTQETRMGTFEEGFYNAMEKSARTISTEFQRGQQMFEAVMSNMENALNQFVRTGKLSFKDFARSVIQDLIMIQMRAQMMSMFTGFKTLFGGGFLNERGGIEPAGALGFADGGEPPVGVASLVGERGPELFVPKVPGTIIPNNQLTNMIGGQTVNYNGPYIQSMQAIDTQSATQFLARNKQAVFAANLSAQRSLPVNK
jgi:lambda family phage tail tape measure protein